MSDLAAGGSGPEIDAVAVATAEALGSRGGEPVGPGTGHTRVQVAFCAGVPVVTEQCLNGGGDISSWIPPSMFELAELPVHIGGRQEDDCQRSFPILLRRLSELDQRDSVVRGLFRAVDRLEDLGVRFFVPEHNGGRRETDQHVPRLEDPEEHFRQEMHIDLPWVQGELTVTFTPLASRRGSSTDFGP